MWFLFTLNHWIFHGAVGFRINHDGTISEHGEVTRWALADLLDTGQTASPPNYP